MVWGGICLGGRTGLYVVNGGTLTAVRYRDKILAPIVRPFACATGKTFLFMQDNARVHTARVSMTFLRDEGIQVIEWPARSPDPIPIEHAWDMLSRRVRSRQPPPDSIRTLVDALVQEWADIPQESLRRLILSMPQRCSDCIRARGGHTHY
jgi:transposase